MQYFFIKHHKSMKNFMNLAYALKNNTEIFALNLA